MRTGAFSALLVLSLGGLAYAAMTVRVENPAGGVRAVVVNSDQARMTPSCRTREVREGDVRVVRQEGLAVMMVQPADGAVIDVEVRLPYGFQFQARTTSGSIEVEGMIRKAELITDSGDLRLAAPWRITRLSIDAEREPREFVKPPGLSLVNEKWRTAAGIELWAVRDKLDEMEITYGRVVAQAGQPGRIVLEDIAVPSDAPVKLPFLAPGIVKEIVARQKPPARSRRPAAPPQPAPEGSGEAITVTEGIPVFSSKVRLVNLTASVVDREGRPVTGLAPADFTVIEDGVPQEVSFAGSEEVPFNLVLLLDLSGSTRRDRDAMKTAAKEFIRIARPHDKVAVYALANNMFQVASTLTSDRERLLKLIDGIPDVSGGSPLYDILVLAYDHELRRLPAERNAIIVITDGLDNRIHGVGAASLVDIRDLRRLAEGIPVLLYPIFLDPYTVAPAPGHVKKARQNLESLAAASGGRLFSASSIRDLDPVYPQVAEELRSVYTVAYSPRNQTFDGSWRNVEVRVKRPGARVRTRTGYYAQ